MERTSGTPEDADGRESWAGEAGRAEGHTVSLAAVVFRGMLGGRFPRGLCYRLGRMTSPRYQILNLLAPAAYPRQDIQTVPPHTARPTGRPNLPHTYHIAAPVLPSKPTPSTTSLSLHLPCRAYVVCSYNAGYLYRDAQFARRARAPSRSAISYTEGTRRKIVF